MSKQEKIRAITRLVEKGWVTQADAARVLDVTPPTIKAMVDRGELRAFKVGKQYRIYEDELLDYLVRSGRVTEKAVKVIRELDKGADDDEY